MREREGAASRAHPDRLADLYLEVTDDLAYAQTFFPGSPTEAYLNGLAADAHRHIHRNRREDRGRFVRFFTHEVPRAVYDSRLALFASFLIFGVAVLVGIVSSAHDPEFVRMIMGDGYVNMTLENIENEDPMAVYKKMHQVDMFLAITLNNIRVSLMAFAMGLLTPLGVGYVLLSNGVMLGSFHHMFYEQGLLLPSLLVIYIHGTLEILAIVIAGGAGLTMACSVLLPGSYPRGTAFIRGAKRGAKIVLGLVPVFITAGFLESFVTRLTEMPLAISLLIIGLSLAFIVGYFIVLPWRMYGRRVKSMSA